MVKPEKVQYLCRNKVSWKVTLIMIGAISLLWALVLFIPRTGARAGADERNSYFYILLSLGLGIDLLILYSSLLRRWAKTWIVDGVVHSDFATRLLFPLSREMALRDVREVCLVYNASLKRKTTDYPNAKAFRQMREELAGRIDSLVGSGNISSAVSLEDGKYSFPAYCGRLILKDAEGRSLPVDLNLTLYRANLKEVGRFLSFLPPETRRGWRFGRVSIWTKGSMF